MALGGIDKISIGSNNAIYEGIWLKAEEGAEIIIGDNNYIGHRVHLHAVGRVVLGNNIMLTDSVTITTGEHDQYNHDKIWTKGDIVIGDNVFIGEKAIILGGVTIGEGATVGAGAVVTKDVPAGVTVAGVPARMIS
ncbi:acyltransferase [Rothia sp. ZJ1223]|nr:acyltransferase [Rothia sp. ZJ1223]